ncbi:hypothetical protein M8J77_010530 [Diaphorina citri]|nr:hypothetical protein M8J77_010530 [Diaphorina citri]
MAAQPTSSLFVTYVSVESPFFVIYGQTDKGAVENINQCIKSYTPHFEVGVGKVTSPQQQLTVGLICVGKYVDQVYYRVKILSINLAAQEVEGFFIDFGNTATIKVSDLRLVALPKASNFLNVKPLCSKYVIANTVLEKGMEEKALHWIRPYVTNEETMIRMVDPRINAIECYFSSTGKSYSISSSLVHKGYGTAVTPADHFYMYQNIMEQNIPPAQLHQPPPVKPVAVAPAASALPQPYGALAPAAPQPVLRLQPMQRPPVHFVQQEGVPAGPATYPQPRPAMAHPKPQSDALVQNQIYQVLVTYVDEEDMTIVVHKKEDADNELRSLVENINSFPVQPYQSILEPGAYVLARQEPSSPLCRAVVVRIMTSEEQCQVYFSDFGHKAYIQMSDVYQLPEQFATQKSMAHRCHLANLDQAGPWSKEVRTELEAIVANRVLNMKILTSPMKTKRTVTLSFVEDNRSVVDVLVQQLKPLMFESVHIPKGHNVEVIISHALNAARFFVQLTSNQAGLDALMAEVQSHCEAELAKGAGRAAVPFSEDELINGNLPCCALYPEDGRWYRAIVSDFVPPASVTVRYVDYGNESVVSPTDILPIPRHLMKVRTQAVECSLAGQSSRRQSEIEEAQFEALLEAHNYQFLMSIKMHLVGSVLLVELWEQESKNSVRSILEAMVIAAQKAAQSTPSKPVQSSPDVVSSISPLSKSSTDTPRTSHYSDPARDGRSSRELAKKPERYRAPVSSSDESDAARPQRKPSSRDGNERSGSGRFERGERPASKISSDRPPLRKAGSGAESNDWSQKKPYSRYNGDDSSTDKKPGRFGGDRDGDSRPPRKPRYGDENERPGGGGNRYGSGDDRGKSGDERGGFKSQGGDNKFRSGDRGSSFKSAGGRDDKGGNREERGGWKKKGEDFTSDNWGAGKSFNAAATNSFPPAASTEPKKPKLLDPYPAGGRVPSLPALGALESRLVSVTHYESPLSFFVQLRDSHDSFLEFMKGLQSDYIKRRPIERSQLQVGLHVMAQFSEDKALYRAEVLQTSPEIKVKFFDYGNESSVPEGKVWSIASEHCALPMQSIRCRLSNTESAASGEAVRSWSLDCVQYFTEDNYQMNIRGYDEQSIAEVELSSVDSGVQVSTRLVEAGLCKRAAQAASVEDPIYVPLLVDQILATHVSYIETSTRFFIHVEPDKPALIAAKITEVMSKPEELFPLTPEEIVVDKFVLATPDLESWYRARVTESAPPSYTVQFIDYGDSAQVPLENVRDIPESLCAWCPQALECTLESKLAEAGETNFAEEYNDVDVTVLVTGVDENNRLSVILYSSDSGARLDKYHPNLESTSSNVPSTVSPLAPYPVLRQGDRVIISHTSPSGLHLQNTAAEPSLNAFVADLHAFYSATDLPALESPSPGLLCAAKSVTFDTWYRARITTIEPELRVSYVDYGNDEILPVSNLRPLDPTHYYPPAFCLPATLPLTLESYESLADCEEEFTVEYARGEAGWLVNLTGENGCLAEKLTLSGVAKPSGGEDVFAPAESVIACWLRAGSVPVTVMSFDSPSDLSVVLASDEKAQEALQARLQDYASRTLPILGACEELCLGKFSEDSQWYRARVLDAEFRALFVDYGNQDIVPEIRKLDYPLRQIPPYSVKCTLPVVPAEGDAWSQAAIDRLDALALENTPQAKILDYAPVPCIELTIEGKSVADLLVEEKLALPKTYRVLVTHVNSPEDFYIQYVDQEALDEIYRVTDVIETNAPLSEGEVQVGDVIAAKYTLDEAWYRARVVKPESAASTSSEPPTAAFQVLFIDFGNTSVASEFRRLPRCVANLPPLATQVRLATPDPWPDTATEKLEALASGGEREFELRWLQGRTVVELFIGEKGTKTNVTELLLAPPPPKSYVLSHINDATDFYVQLLDDPALDSIAAQLAPLDSEPPLGSVNTGDLLAAKFTDDEQWYRARVLNAEGHTRVLFIDYGNTAVASEFRALPDPLRTTPPTARRCTLAGSYSKAANEKFVELSLGGDTVYRCEFVGESVEGVCPVCLYIGEEKVTDLLAGAETVPPALETNPTGPNVGQSPVAETISTGPNSGQVSICWVNSPDDFYVQAPEDGTLDRVADQLAAIAEEAPIAVTPGAVVAAQFADDDLWYRSRVLAQVPSDETPSAPARYEVLFLDYGNKSEASAFRELPETVSIALIPPCARQCSLVRPRTLGDWPENATDTLNEYADLELRIEEVGDGKVELYVDGKRLSHLIAGLDEATLASENPEPIQEKTEPTNELEFSEPTNDLAEKKSEVESSVDKGNGDLVDDEEFSETITSSNFYSPTKTPASPTKTSSPLKAANEPVSPTKTTNDSETIRASSYKTSPAKTPEVSSPTPSSPTKTINEAVSPTKIPTSPTKTTEGSTKTTEGPKTEVPTKTSDGSAKTDRSKPQSSLKEKALASEKTKVHLITHVNSPSDFYLMFDAATAIALGTLLNNAADFEPVHSVLLGGLYAAFNEREDSWHRAQLLSIEDDEDESGVTLYCVKYLDLGNTDVVTKSELRELPEDIRAMPSVVKHCELATDTACIWCDAAVRKLTDLLVTGQFHIEAISDDDPARVVLRTTDGVNVNRMLLEINAASGETHSRMNAGETHAQEEDTLNDTILSEAPSKDLAGQRVTVTHAVGPDDFYVRVIKDTTIQESINSLLSGLKPLSAADVNIGDIYAGHCAGAWYRVRITKPLDTGFEVRRIDYGDTHPCTQFKQLTEDLSHIGALAHHCTGLVSPSDLPRWTEGQRELTVVSVREEEDGLVVELSEDGIMDREELITESGQPEMPSESETMEVVAENSETLAKKSETLAANSETLAEKSETLAEKSETLAAKSESLAAKSETLAAKSESLTAKSESVATKSESVAAKVESVAAKSDSTPTNPETAPSKSDPIVNTPDPNSSPSKVSSGVQVTPLPTTVSLGVQVTPEGSEPLPVASNGSESPEVASNGVANTSLDETFVSCVGDTTIVAGNEMADQEAYIIDCSSIDDFYIHLESDTQTLQDIGDALGDVTDKTHPLVPTAEARLNEIYVCRFEDDGLYYRARVEPSSADLCRVRFIDYGNVSDASEFRQCPADLRTDRIPPVAKRCQFPPGEFDLSPLGALGKAFVAFDWSNVNLKVKSLTGGEGKPTGEEGKAIVELVVAETGQNVLAHLAASLGEDVDK